MTDVAGRYTANGFGKHPRDAYSLSLVKDRSFRFAYTYHTPDGDGSVRLSGSYDASRKVVTLRPTEVQADFSDPAQHGAGYSTTYEYTSEPIPVARDADTLVVPVLSRYCHEVRIPSAVPMTRRKRSDGGD